MELKNRSDIANYVTGLEKQFPVNGWTVGGIHLWPYLRIQLFFFLINELESQEQKKPAAKQAVSGSLPGSKQSSKIKIYVKNVMSAFKFWFWLNNIKQRHYVFVAYDAHRVDYGNKRFNRFFDPLISKYKLANDIALIDYMPNNRELVNYGEHLIDYTSHYAEYIAFSKLAGKIRKKEKVTTQLEGYGQFLDFLSRNSVTTKFAERYPLKKVIAIAEESIMPYMEYFSTILKKLKPQTVFTLCYYNQQAMIFVAAANRLGIKTVEMQHGPQPCEHLCFGQWSNMPQSGYDFLPRNFWCWDKESESVIKNWAAETKLYKAVNAGNPWIDYCLEKPKISSDQEFILYSLQPEPVSLNELFSSQIINTIKASGLLWYLRLHPRMLDKKKEIEAILSANNISANIDDATNLPLPLLLAKTKLHVTHFSGTAIEASLMKVYSILLSETGQIYYKDLIAQNRAVYLDPASNVFNEQFAEILKCVPQLKDVNQDKINPDYLFKSC